MLHWLPGNPALSSRRLSVICCAGHPAEYNFSFDFSYNSFVPKDDPVYATQQQLWTDIGDGILTNAYNGALFMSMLAWDFLSHSLCSKVILVGEPAGFVPNTPPTFRLAWTVWAPENANWFSFVSFSLAAAIRQAIFVTSNCIISTSC